MELKQFWKEVGLAVILGMIMPGFILNMVTYSARHHSTKTERYPETVVKMEESTQTGRYVAVQMQTGEIAQMELESYLVGVVLAEMPASFHEEALKAQAVVARTYTLRAVAGKSKHDTAAVCTDSTCCQAFCSPDEYMHSGGLQENVDRVSSSVKATEGQVLVYQGELIEATYFSCSGGSTEDAVAVWGADVPYLQAVASPGEENAAHFSDSITLTNTEFCEAIGIRWRDDLFGEVTYTAGGGVETIEIGGKTYSGVEIRRLLNLRSTAFTWTMGDNTVTFHTRGYGHRVGMSQYGADAMAEAGSSYQEILTHYYQGTELTYRLD